MKESRMQWEQFFASGQPEQHSGLGDSLRALAHSDELQRLSALLASKGEQMQSASDAAIQGDTRAFEALIKEVTRNPEGAEVLDRLRARIRR